MSPPKIGDLRYLVEIIDYAKGAEIVRAAGGDPERDAIFDFCDQDEITTHKAFPAKWRAVQWARRHRKLDAFNMPRIVEQTYQQIAGDSLHYPSPPGWIQTGYWETDGVTEIDPMEYPR